MIRAHLFTLVMLSLGFIGCGNESDVPSAPTSETPLLNAKVTDRFHSHGQDAFAFASFQEAADPPCQQTEIFVDEASLLIQTPTGVEKSRQLAVTGQSGDACGAGTFFNFFAPADGLRFEERGNLDRATLQGTLVVLDVRSGTQLSGTVDLVWTGVGPLQSSVSRTRSNGESKFHEQTKTSFREAEVTGTLIVNGQNLVFGPGIPSGLGQARGDTLQQAH
jgi:hypothetical protein